ncbi:MAG: hypothetical protein KKB62_02990 [Nanoarchaeota archaeon]|nr:hypothetical protein [Nanoarchaeota archaeon]
MEIKENYLFYVKDHLKKFSMWKPDDTFYFLLNRDCENRDGGSLKDVNNYLKDFQEKGMHELVNKKIRKNSLILKFRAIPHRDSEAFKNPFGYKKHFVSLKIVPVLSLENKVKR